MEVILLERVAKLGQIGDVVRVKDGFARNFLLPKGKALRATKDNKVKFESMKVQLETRNIELKGEAHKIGEKIVIVEGPLKDLEGQITRIDKRNRSGQVTVQFAGRQQKIWLGFDIVKELPEHEACTAAREP